MYVARSYRCTTRCSFITNRTTVPETRGRGGDAGGVGAGSGGAAIAVNTTAATTKAPPRGFAMACFEDADADAPGGTVK